jgi:N-acetylglutamate synthase-like GNAT family acetyltransferase
MPQQPDPKSAAALQRPDIVDVTADTIAEHGFFCYMSKKKSEGYQRKLRWLKARFAEGMRIKLFALPERGFIEYVPGEYAWRAVNADGYMLIHCLWVVGKSKGKGFGAVLLDECIADARRSKLKGVAMVSSEKVWLAHKGLLVRHGFECVDRADPTFSLMVTKFGKFPGPSFAGDWEKKASVFGRGLTVVRSDQCPYIVDATVAAVDCAAKAKVECAVVELESRDDVMRRSPTPYGVFGIVLNGKIVSYHYMLEKDLLPVLRAEKD